MLMYTSVEHSTGRRNDGQHEFELLRKLLRKLFHHVLANALLPDVPGAAHAETFLTSCSARNKAGMFGSPHGSLLLCKRQPNLLAQSTLESSDN